MVSGFFALIKNSLLKMADVSSVPNRKQMTVES